MKMNNFNKLNEINFTVEPKEMIYQDRVTEVLARGFYKDYEFVAASYGTHPVAYIIIKRDHPINRCDLTGGYGEGENEPLNVTPYGGFTWQGEFQDRDRFGGIQEDETFIGWDFNHYNDFCFGSSYLGGCKWSIDMILKDVISTIDELVEFDRVSKLRGIINGTPTEIHDPHKVSLILFSGETVVKNFLSEQELLATQYQIASGKISSDDIHLEMWRQHKEFRETSNGRRHSCIVTDAKVKITFNPDGTLSELIDDEFYYTKQLERAIALTR